MSYWYPWVSGFLTIPLYGSRAQRNRLARSDEAVTLPLHPSRVELELNSHNEADRLELIVDWRDGGVDPRLIDDGTIELHMGDSKGGERPLLSRATCRFIGALRLVGTHRDGNQMIVSLSAVSYETFFLEANPFGSAGIPDYSMSLREALMHIISQVPGAKDLFQDRSKLKFEGGVTGDEPLGAAVSQRFAKLAKVPTHPRTDAWAVVQQTCGMIGLVAFFRLDELIVSTFTNLYTESDAPTFVWGRNLLSWSEERYPQQRKAIMLSSFDPESGKAIEAFYPPQSDDRVKRKRMPAVGIGSSVPVPMADEDREVLQYPAVSSQAQLNAIAQQIYEERSRQQLEGTITTGEMSVATERGSEFDLLNLKAGDSIRIDVDTEEREALRTLQSAPARINYLVSLGYSREVAGLMVDSMRDLHRLESKFFATDVRIELETSGDSGKFRVEVGFINRIQLTGDTEPGA